jgi:hypothetical protein
LSQKRHWNIIGAEEIQTDLKKACKIMEQEEHHKNSPRMSWETAKMGNFSLWDAGTTGAKPSDLPVRGMLPLENTGKICHEKDFGFVVGDSLRRFGLGFNPVPGEDSNFPHRRGSDDSQCARDHERHRV